MKAVRKRLLLYLLGGLVVIQFVPLERANPPVEGEVDAPDVVLSTLRSSCYDCHSNETRWPWYSRVAPVSWWIARHVREGRQRLNFSTWAGMSGEDQGRAKEDIWEAVERGSMPLSDYLRMHPEAVLTDPQMEAVRRWAEGRAQVFPDWN
jgi:hypothetical protein